MALIRPHVHLFGCVVVLVTVLAGCSASGDPAYPTGSASSSVPTAISSAAATPAQLRESFIAATSGYEEQLAKYQELVRSVSSDLTSWHATCIALQDADNTVQGALGAVRWPSELGDDVAAALIALEQEQQTWDFCRLASTTSDALFTQHIFESYVHPAQIALTVLAHHLGLADWGQ